MSTDRLQQDLNAAAAEDFGAGRLPREACELAMMYRARAQYFENLATQAETQLRSLGVLPVYFIPGMTAAYLNEN